MSDVKPTRRTRRVLLVLMTGATNLSGYPISRAAAVHSGGVYVTLAKLERAGWVASEWGAPNAKGDRRRFYHLTLKGRTKAIGLLGLEMPS